MRKTAAPPLLNRPNERLFGEAYDKKSISFFLSLIRVLVKFVVLQSHSQSICVLNQCHIKFNTHAVSHIKNFCLFPLIFYPHEICLIVAFVFIQLTCNNMFRSAF
eukprot:UN24391